MGKRDDPYNENQNSESSARAREPKDDEREEHDSGCLDVVIDGNSGDDERFGVQKVKIEVGHDDEKTAEESERGCEDGEGGHEQQDDEVVEGVVLGILLDAIEEVCKLRLAHLRSVEKLAPWAGPRPDIAHALLERLERGDHAGDAGQGRNGGDCRG